jgi:hypothetical protein
MMNLLGVFQAMAGTAALLCSIAAFGFLPYYPFWAVVNSPGHCRLRGTARARPAT